MAKKQQKKILVVEDDALLSQVLQQSLTDEGYNVVSVMNGLEALDVTKKISPDLILLDLLLPGLDGFEVLKRLKSDEAMKAIPVVVISNLDDVADIKSARALGAEEYFVKATIRLEKIIDFIKKRIG